MSKYILAFLVFFAQATAFAGIAVEPAYVSLDFAKGRASGRFIITNTGDKEERYRVIASYFTFSENGQLALAEPDKHSMAAWIKFNPKEFTLPPKSKRAVRYVVLPRGQVRDGQYWAAMELESLEGRNYSTDDGEGRTFNLKVVPSVLAPMYGSAGAINRTYEVESFEIARSDRNKRMLQLKLKNTGNAVISFVGKFAVQDAAGETVAEGTLDSGLLLREKSRMFVSYIDPQLPAGNYKLIVNYTGRDTEEVLVRELDLAID